MEIHFDEKSIVMEDYKRLKGYGLKINELQTKQSRKGHREELIQLYHALTSEHSYWPIPFEDMINTTKITHLISSSHG